MPRIRAAKKARRESVLKNRIAYEKVEIPDITDAVTDNVLSIAAISQPSTTRSSTKFKNDELEVSTERFILSDKKAAHMLRLHQKKADTFPIRKVLQKTRKDLISEKRKTARQARTDKATKEQPNVDDLFNSSDDIARVDILEDDVPDVMIFPAFETNNQFFPKSPSSIPSFASSSNSPKDLSKPGLYKRKRAFEESVKKDLGPEYRVTNSPAKQATLEAALRWKTRNRITDEAYQDLSREFFPSLTSLKKYRNELLEILKKESEGSLSNAVITYFNGLDSFDFEEVRINFGADKGSNSTKVVWYLVDMDNPLSQNNLHIFSCYIGGESRTELKPYMDIINETMFTLQAELIDTDHGLKRFTCFWISDCKMSDECLGLQGGSATCPCTYCTMASKTWKDFEVVPVSALRTIDDLQQAGERVEQAAAAEFLTPKQLADKKKENYSVKATPLITAIPLRRFVPPVVHISISAVSSTVKYCKEKGTDTIMFDQITSKKIGYHQGTSDYTGPNCRKILHHFMNHPEIDGYGIDILRSFANVEQYAEARDLTEDEIDKLDDAIKEFFKLIDENYPDLLGRKTKLHILRFHVMPFVRTYKSWGKFSEQSLEHIHHIKNECDRRIPGKTEAAKAKQLKYFTDQHMLIVYFASH
uniref:Uncharacterized protein n=1 Tax=Panagrolaimus sp. PS1159 TaxID=55785 RepID=A0AC35FHM0_9BILA